MSDILVFFFGVLLGFVINYNRKPQTPVIEVLSNQVQELERQLAYYKDLCMWHVEEKQKLKQEHYIDE